MERHSSVKNIAEGHFRPEGYLSDSSEEYLEQFLTTVEQMGFDPKELIYSGFDGTPLKHGWPPSKHPTIFGMNHAGWRESIKNIESNPAEYAANWLTPCIALYDKSQLSEAYHYDLKTDVDSPEDRMNLGNVKKGRDLSDVDASEPLEEAFIHKDYPARTPDDALLGIVYLHD